MISEIVAKGYIREEGCQNAKETDKVFKGPDGVMYSALELKALMTEAWSNNACLGYAILALEELKYPKEEISRIISCIKGKFEWSALDEANQHYCRSRY